MDLQPFFYTFVVVSFMANKKIRMTNLKITLTLTTKYPKIGLAKAASSPFNLKLFCTTYWVGFLNIKRFQKRMFWLKHCEGEKHNKKYFLETTVHTNPIYPQNSFELIPAPVPNSRNTICFAFFRTCPEMKRSISLVYLCFACLKLA